jgi:hypothetical protein
LHLLCARRAVAHSLPPAGDSRFLAGGSLPQAESSRPQADAFPLTTGVPCPLGMTPRHPQWCGRPFPNHARKPSATARPQGKSVTPQRLRKDHAPAHQLRSHRRQEPRLLTRERELAGAPLETVASPGRAVCLQWQSPPPSSNQARAQTHQLQSPAGCTRLVSVVSASLLSPALSRPRGVPISLTPISH